MEEVMRYRPRNWSDHFIERLVVTPIGPFLLFAEFFFIIIIWRLIVEEVILGSACVKGIKTTWQYR